MKEEDILNVTFVYLRILFKGNLCFQLVISVRNSQYAIRAYVETTTSQVFVPLILEWIIIKLTSTN